MTTFSAQAILKSSSAGNPATITTLLSRYPRWIHAEVMTHRAFGRNASSSRALPFKRLLDEAVNDPAMPVYWMADGKGMHSGVFITDPNIIAKLEYQWKKSRDDACARADSLHALGVHKSLCNRLLEPYTHITLVITATEWANFWALRCHDGAEPHMRLLAERMRFAHTAAPVQILKPGEWHLPFLAPPGATGVVVRDLDLAKKLSVARCASTSYNTVEGFDMTVDRAVSLYEKLSSANPMHASPFEHQATPDVLDDQISGWQQPHLHGNLVGWVQLRKTMPGEATLQYA